MRIGVDLRCLMDGKRTGVEEYTLGILRAMIALSPKDTFVLFANSRKPMRLPSFPASNVELRTFRYPNKLFNLSLKLAQQPTLDALVGGVDTFFVPSIRLAPVGAQCPLVLTIHDLSFVRHPEFFSFGRRIWHTFMEPQRLAQQAHAVIAVSSTTAEDVSALYGVSPERISVIPSGIPMASASAATPSHVQVCRERYRLPERFLLYLGTLEPRKNLDALLDAYALVRAAGFPHALVLAGVRGWVDKGFFTRVQQHLYRDDIILTGFVDDADKPAVYQLADLFVYPSFYEGFGFPPLEALASGTPVVTSFNSAIPEIVGDWAALVNPYDPEEIAMVIADRLRNPARVPAEVSAAIRVRYTWERAAAETLRVLHRVAEQQ